MRKHVNRSVSVILDNPTVLHRGRDQCLRPFAVPWIERQVVHIEVHGRQVFDVVFFGFVDRDVDRREPSVLERALQQSLDRLSDVLDDLELTHVV